MIRLWIPSFYDKNKAMYSNTRAVDDGENYDIIGCSCGSITYRLIKGLKEHNIRSPYLHITKISYDNYCGIREIINDNWFTPKGLYCPDPISLYPKFPILNERGHKHVQVEILNLMTIIREAREKGISVTYVTDGQVIEHGDVKIICYTNDVATLDADDDDGRGYINKKTVCYWLPDIRYLSTGNGYENIYDVCIEKELNPVFLRLPNHGKGISWEQAQKLKDLGVLYCWDNSDENTDGKRNCIQSGITYLDCHRDINGTFASGKAIIATNGNNYIYDVPYNTGRFEEGWVKNFDGWWYRHNDGSWAVGWKTIKHKGQDLQYYFDEDGYSVSGWRYITPSDGSEKTWYYFDQLNGSMKTGWIEEDGLWYYFDADGKMHKGWLDYEGKKCYFEPTVGEDKSPAYRNRIALIGDEIWSFDSYCYGVKVE